MEMYKAMVNRKTIIEHGIDGMEELLKEIWVKIQDLLKLEGK